MLSSTHRTREGEEMLIAQMENRHLLNTINVYVRKAEEVAREFDQACQDAEEAQKALNSGTHAQHQAKRKLYGLPDPPNLEKAASQYARKMDATSIKMQNYVLELFTRIPCLNGEELASFYALGHKWALAIGRSEALPRPRLALAPPADTIIAVRPNIDDEWEWIGHDDIPL